VNKSGFSLIEALVSMTLALLLVIGTAEIITLSIWAKKRGDTAAALAHALSARIESLKSLSFASDALQPGAYSETVGDEAGRGLFRHEWTIEDAGDGMKRIRVTISPAARPGAAASMTVWISGDVRFAP